MNEVEGEVMSQQRNLTPLLRRLVQLVESMVADLKTYSPNDPFYRLAERHLEPYRQFYHDHGAPMATVMKG
jgi:hypothetical protein